MELFRYTIWHKFQFFHCFIWTKLISKIDPLGLIYVVNRSWEARWVNYRLVNSRGRYKVGLNCSINFFFFFDKIFRPIIGSFYNFFKKRRKNPSMFFPQKLCRWQWKVKGGKTPNYACVGQQNNYLKLLSRRKVAETGLKWALDFNNRHEEAKI